MNIIEWAAGQPLAIDPASLDAVESALASAAMIAGKPGARSESSRSLSVRDGIGTIDVRGVISRHDSIFSWLLGGTSTESMARGLRSALDDPEVGAIVLHVDSPGGQGTGIGELAGYVRKASRTKPVVAYVEGQASSAAYYIASAASEIVIAPAATLGSIGAMVQIDSRSRPGQIVMVSSQSPLKNEDVKTDAGRASVQAWLDSLAAVFVADVARYRGVSEKTVLERFGRGGSLVGKDAVDAGMADRLGDFEGVLESFRDTGKALAEKSVSRRRFAERGGKSDSRQGNHMNPFTVLANLWAKDPESVNEAVASSGGSVVNFGAAPPARKSDADTRAEIEAELTAKIEADIRAKYEAKAKVDARASLEASAKAKAVEWVALLGDRITPAQAASVVPTFVDIAILDAESPLSITLPGGSNEVVSRLEAFKAPYEAKAPHGMTKETVPADKGSAAKAMLAKAGRVLPSADDEDAAAETDFDSLLAMTSLGRSVKKAKANG